MSLVTIPSEQIANIQGQLRSAHVALRNSVAAMKIAQAAYLANFTAESETVYDALTQAIADARAVLPAAGETP